MQNEAYYSVRVIWKNGFTHDVAVKGAKGLKSYLAFANNLNDVVSAKETEVTKEQYYDMLFGADLLAKEPTVKPKREAKKKSKPKTKPKSKPKAKKKVKKNPK